MPTWRELEHDFRELEPAFQFSRLDIQWGSAGVHYRIAGRPDVNAESRFEALSRMAGEKLSQTPEPPEQYHEVLSEPNSVHRWYKAIWKLGQSFETGFIAQELDKNGNVVGYIYTGHIDRPAAAAATFCLELASRFPTADMANVANHEPPVGSAALKPTLAPSGDFDLVNSIIGRIRRHPIGAAIILLAILFGGLASFTSSVDAIWSFVEDRLRLSATGRLELPGETGWIFVGYFDINREVFIEGPYVSVVSSARRGNRRYIEIGDRIRLNVSRRVYIVNFENSGTLRKLESPITKGVLDESDETGVTLAASTELIVRDLSEGHWPGNPNAALWVRVVHMPR